MSQVHNWVPITFYLQVRWWAGFRPASSLSPLQLTLPASPLTFTEHHLSVFFASLLHLNLSQVSPFFKTATAFWLIIYEHIWSPIQDCELSEEALSGSALLTCFAQSGFWLMNLDNGEVPSTAFLLLTSKNLLWGNIVNFQLYSEGLNIIPGAIRSNGRCQKWQAFIHVWSPNE